jgi:nucleotide-binding universal stress UspA family protein
MSSHGRSGLSRLLIGSVTNKVLTLAKVPVLICQ